MKSSPALPTRQIICGEKDLAARGGEIVAKIKPNGKQVLMNETGATNSEKVGLFQIVILILSIVVLGALGADAAFKLPKEVSDILQTLDTLVCILLLTDFGIRFYKAKSKLAFMKWGRIDLIASIPNVPI
jgi:hypothetical protein